MSFHVQKNILKKTTLNPKTECGKRLKFIATHFICERWKKQKFKKEFEKVLEQFKDFLNEKNEKNQYVHRQLRSAFFWNKISFTLSFYFSRFSKFKYSKYDKLLRRWSKHKSERISQNSQRHED